MQNFYNFNPNLRGKHAALLTPRLRLIAFLSSFFHIFFISSFNEDELLLLNEN